LTILRVSRTTRRKLNKGLTMNNTQRRSAWSAWYLLFIIEFVAVLWPPFYNKAEPSWIGIPYFYWYQMLWVIISAVITVVVYLATRD